MTTRILLEDYSTPAAAIDVRLDDDGPGILLDVELVRDDVHRTLRDAGAATDARIVELLRVGADLYDGLAVWRTLTEDLTLAVAEHLARAPRGKRPTTRERNLRKALADIDARGEAEVAGRTIYDGDYANAPARSAVELGVYRGHALAGGHGAPASHRLDEEATRNLSAAEARTLAAVLWHHADELDRRR